MNDVRDRVLSKVPEVTLGFWIIKIFATTRFLRLPEPAAEKIAGKEITRSAPAEKCPHGDDGWGEFVMAAAPAADQRQRAPDRLYLPSFSSHHEAASRRPRREARAPCGVISRSAKR
jgi:hypothetical protein